MHVLQERSKFCNIVGAIHSSYSCYRRNQCRLIGVRDTFVSRSIVAGFGLILSFVSQAFELRSYKIRCYEYHFICDTFPEFNIVDRYFGKIFINNILAPLKSLFGFGCDNRSQWRSIISAKHVLLKHVLYKALLLH